MEAAGASAENIERELAKYPVVAESLLEIGADDEGPAIGLFLALDTQWRTAGMAGVRTGLDYAMIRPTADLLGIDLHPGVFLDLQTMEQEAIKVALERLAKR